MHNQEPSRTELLLTTSIWAFGTEGPPSWSVNRILSGGRQALKVGIGFDGLNWEDATAPAFNTSFYICMPQTD